MFVATDGNVSTSRVAGPACVDTTHVVQYETRNRFGGNVSTSRVASPACVDTTHVVQYGTRNGFLWERVNFKRS
jgi:hypothetical protein